MVIRACDRQAQVLVLVLVAALVASGCSGSGGAPDEVEPIARVERHPYTGPTDRGAGVGPPPAPAADHLVTSAADSGAGSLRAAIAAAAPGDVIALASTLAGATLRLTASLSVPQGRDLTLVGVDAPGFCLDGQNQHRILAIARETEVELIGLCFRHGRAPTGNSQQPGEGGAIKAGDHGALVLRHCRFEDNLAERGGAVRAGYGTELTVEDCSFLRNDGSSLRDGFSAGAIATFGHAALVVRRCWFEDNRGHSGGAIYNLLQPLTIEDSTFLFNWSSGGGGAVFTDEGNWVGPKATTGGHIRVRRCWVQDNHSVGVGGGLFLWANRLDEVTIEDCVLAYNRVDRSSGGAKGGGLRTLGRIAISRCAFVGNTAAQQGGGAWLDGDGPITISDSSFSGNQVVDDAGGGLILNHRSTAEPIALKHCSFVGNHAGRACGAFWLPRATNGVSIVNTLVVDNQAGDHGQDQIGYPPEFDGGGCLQWPGSGGTIAASRVVADPLLGTLDQDGAMLFHPLLPGSPAIGLAVEGAATATDSRGLARDGDPDSGAAEAEPAGDG
jgi:hypothetical protein